MKRNILFFTLLIFLLAVEGYWIYQKQQIIKNSVLDEVKTTMSELVLQKEASLIKAGDFSLTDKAEKDKVFGLLFSSLQSPELVRLKVWDPNYEVIWSNLPELIGERFPDNSEVRDALNGEVALDEGLDKTEHITERQFENPIEIYVPFVSSTKVVGVVEIYVSSVPSDTKISDKLLVEVNKNILILLSPVILLALIFLVNFLAVKKRSV